LHGYYHLAHERAGAERSSACATEATNYHLARERAGARLRWWIAQKVVSSGEAELSGVTREQAEQRLDDGVRVLRDAGLRMDGFVAPAWSLPTWLLPLLAARGCRYSEDRTHVYDPHERRKRASVVLNFASRTPVRLWSSVAYCRVATAAHPLLPARIALHPKDLRVDRLRRETARLLDWGRGRYVASGRALLG
jgi:predicted deacetylase